MEVNGVPEYINFDRLTYGFPTFTVLVSPSYLIPTLVIVARMFYLYFTMFGKNKTAPIQKHLFSSFLLMQIGNFSYIITDNIVLRIPATGILTSWCASLEPNQYLKIPYLIAFISSYSSMLYPVLFCANRAIIVFYPKDHNEICSRLMRISLPISIILPIILSCFMIPTIGRCVQLTSPYPFGAIMFSLNMKVPINEVIHLFTSFLCFTLALAINITMLIKVRHILFNKSFSNRQINRNYKAELSLTITMISLFIPFLINAIVTILAVIDQSLIGYILSIRPFAVDAATVFVPWAFYLSHPMFQKRTTISSSPAANTMNSSIKVNSLVKDNE